jgi:hypothetical protein
MDVWVTKSEARVGNPGLLVKTDGMSGCYFLPQKSGLAFTQSSET